MMRLSLEAVNRVQGPHVGSTSSDRFREQVI